MNILRWAALGSLVFTLNLHAQTSGAAPASLAPVSGPTMEQTVSFINEALTAQGSIDFSAGAMTVASKQSVELATPCSPIVRTTDTLTGSGQDDGEAVTMVRFDLERSDPLSVAVSHWNTGFNVDLSRAVANHLPMVTKQQAPLALTGPYDEGGVLRSIDGKDMTFITGKGKWLTVALAEITQIIDATQQQDGKYVVVTPQSLRVGDYVEIKRLELNPSAKKKSDPPPVPQIVLDVSILDKGSDERPRAVTFTRLKDQDKADRVAKAMIHAIVLCHKPEAPSLF